MIHLGIWMKKQFIPIIARSGPKGIGMQKNMPSKIVSNAAAASIKFGCGWNMR
jgi:hypothetical protein